MGRTAAAMLADTRILARNRWLARQTPELREALLGRARITRIDTGQWIYGTGDALNGLYGVIEGSVHSSSRRKAASRA